MSQIVLYLVSVVAQIRSINGEIREHLDSVLVVYLIFHPSLRVTPLSLEGPDLKGVKM